MSEARELFFFVLVEVSVLKSLDTFTRRRCVTLTLVWLNVTRTLPSVLLSVGGAEASVLTASC